LTFWYLCIEKAVTLVGKKARGVFSQTKQFDKPLAILNIIIYLINYKC